MKKVIIIVLFISYNSFSQLKIDSISKTYYFKKIDTVNKTKEEIRSNTKVWFAKTFKNSNSVIRLNDVNQIIGKGNFDINYTSAGYSLSSPIDFTITVSFKEGRYKFEMDNFSIKVGTITNSLELYNSTTTYEEFKKRLFESLKTMSKAQKKMMLKYYKKESNLIMAYQTSKEVTNSIVNESNMRIKEIYKEFKNSINSQKDDW